MVNCVHSCSICLHDIHYYSVCVLQTLLPAGQPQWTPRGPTRASSFLSDQPTSQLCGGLKFISEILSPCIECFVCNWERLKPVSCLFLYCNAWLCVPYHQLTVSMCICLRCRKARDYLLNQPDQLQSAVSWLRRKVHTHHVQLFLLYDYKNNNDLSQINEYTWSHTSTYSNESSSSRVFQRTVSAVVRLLPPSHTLSTSLPHTLPH